MIQLILTMKKTTWGNTNVASGHVEVVQEVVPIVDLNLEARIADGFRITDVKTQAPSYGYGGYNTIITTSHN